MKVLDQIVAYLRQRGALDAVEVAALEAGGFVTRDEDAQPFGDDDWEGEPYPDSADVAHAARPRRRARTGPLKAPTLAARLRAALDAGSAHVLAIAAVAPIAQHPRQVPRAGRWERVEAVARSTPEALGEAIAGALARGVSFRALWDAVGADLAVAALLPGERGPAASAYRALIALREERALGSYRWILKRRPIARAYQLLRAQDRVVEAMHAVYQTRPALAGQWLAREHHPVAYWSFVLLYNAERFAAGRRWAPFAGEAPVRRPLPSGADLAQASMRALQLGGAMAERFLHALWTSEGRARRLWWELGLPGSPPAISLDWLRAAIAADAVLAIGHGPRLLGALDALTRLDAAPAERLAADGLASRSRLGDAADLAGNPHVSLFCPSGWS